MKKIENFLGLCNSIEPWIKWVWPGKPNLEIQIPSSRLSNRAHDSNRARLFSKYISTANHREWWNSTAQMISWQIALCTYLKLHARCIRATRIKNQNHFLQENRHLKMSNANYFWRLAIWMRNKLKECHFCQKKQAPERSKRIFYSLWQKPIIKKFLNTNISWNSERAKKNNRQF